MSQWFVESGSQIQGPFSTDGVKSRLSSGTFSPDDRIWGRVLEEWRTLSWWSTSLTDLIQQERQIANPEIWHYAYDGSSFGPLAWPDLLHNLKSIRATSIDQLTQIMIWTKGMKEWAPVLEFHEILEELGVNKRESPRASIVGKAIIKQMGNVFIAPLKNISEGGFGCEALPGVIAGDNVQIEIQCDALGGPVHARAEVRYSTPDIVGFKFTQINVESRGLVVQYVRKSSGVASKFFLKAA